MNLFGWPEQNQTHNQNDNQSHNQTANQAESFWQSKAEPNPKAPDTRYQKLEPRAEDQGRLGQGQAGLGVTLRGYQSSAIQAVRSALARGHRRALLVLPTGAGKTIVASEIIRRGVERKRRALFLAPRRELVYQTSDKLSALGVPHGLLMAGEGRTLDVPVQVACLPTMHSRVCRSSMSAPRAEIVIVDEAHASMGRMAQAVLDLYPDAVQIGMTATPSRSDGRGLGELYDALVEGPSVAELTRDWYLVPVRYFAPSTVDLEGVRTQAGDYHQGDLSKRVNTPQLIGDVVSNWLRIAADRKTVVFAVDRAHAMALHEEFMRAGVSSEYLDGNTPNDDRKAILGRVRSGETQVLCSVDVLSYGWDEPSVSCGIIARPTKSIARYLQAAGRILRPFDGKTDSILIDHSGVVSELGFVDDTQPWSLDGKSKIQERKAEKAREEPKPITCGDCGAEFKPASKCPECGADCTHRAKTAIEAHEADLIEFSRQRLVDTKRFGLDKQDVYSQLLGFAAERGYSSGWAAHQYREVFDVWPRGLAKHAEEPSKAVRSWCMHRLIRFAKSREAAA